MGSFQGNTGNIWVESRSKGSIALKKEGELIWPVKTCHRQKLTVVGERFPYEQALITCEGRCSGDGVTWTMHACVTHASYECKSCGKVRRWGFDLRQLGSWERDS